MNFSKCVLSIEELEKFRDPEGFIDLDKVEIEFDESSRNQAGEDDIFKYWVDFAGTKVLLKEEKRLGGEENYTLYSELIMSELANQMGVRAARCDLYKYRGKRGVMSHMALEYGKEVLEMTDAIIGTTTEYEEFHEVSDFAEVEQKIRRALKEDMGLSDEEIEGFIVERRKQKVLELFATEADNHTQNEGFVIYKENGKTCFKVAPMFDNEQSFSLQYPEADLSGDLERDNSEMLETMSMRLLYNQINGRSNNFLLTSEDVEKSLQMLNKSNVLKIVNTLKGNTSLRQRGIGNGKLHYISGTNKLIESLSDETLQYILDTDPNFEISFFCDNIVNGLDMENVLTKVEQRIKAPIPYVARETVKRIAKIRISDFDNIVNGKQLDQKYKKAAEYLKANARMRMKKEQKEVDDYGE